MSIETLLCGIGIMQVIIIIILLVIAAIANSAEGKANGTFNVAADVTRQLDTIIRQNSVVPADDTKEDRVRIIAQLNTIIYLLNAVPTNATPAPKPAKVAKVQPTYQPKRNRA